MPRKKETPAVDTEEICTQLKARRDELLAKAKHHNYGGQEELKGDLVDQSTDLSERELMLGLVESDRLKLREIEEALKQIDENSYGICEQCHEPIPIKRLLALPTARYCVGCQQKMERTRSTCIA